MFFVLQFEVVLGHVDAAMGGLKQGGFSDP
jgi:hypothetical protein